MIKTIKTDIQNIQKTFNHPLIPHNQHKLYIAQFLFLNTLQNKQLYGVQTFYVEVYKKTKEDTRYEIQTIFSFF